MQTMQLINDNSATQADQDVYVLFAGNPALVQDNKGNPISGMRNLAIPTGSVSSNQDAGVTTIVSALFQNPTNFTLPAAPFPLLFTSGANAGTTYQIGNYDSSSGTFTVANGGTVSGAQNAGDQFVLGAYSQQLSSLPQNGSYTSPLSGKPVPIYEVQADLAAGVLYVSNGALTYLSAAPSFTTGSTAFQVVELTTGSNGGATTSDLTAIDYFALPLKIESVNLSSGAVDDSRNFYFNAASIGSQLSAIGASVNSGGFYLSPGQVAAANNGSPAPFASFGNYLQALTGQNFTIAGTQNFGAPNPTIVYGVMVAANYSFGYNYACTTSVDKSGNYSIVMTPNASGNSISGGANTGYLPPPANVSNVTINLPAASADNSIGYDAIIYGALLNADSFSINLSEGQVLPATLSGPFSVTSATSSTQFNAAALANLLTGPLAGLTLNFISGANLNNSATITSVDASGNVSLSSALPYTPADGDNFVIAFSTTADSANGSSLLAAQLVPFNFIPPFSLSFCSGLNSGTTVTVSAIDGSGNLTLSGNNVPLTNFPQQGDMFTVSVGSSELFTQLYTNSGYSWAVANVLAGLNFGLVQANTSSADWYASFPQEFPYGVAQPSNPYYNPWAAVLYNVSDAYGFAFSDRIAPSPLLSTDPGQEALRVTLLPQNQINTVLMNAGDVSDSGMTLSWPAQSGVSYSLSSLPPIASSDVTISTANGTAQAVLSNLSAGTPYQISVSATSGSQQALVLPQVFATSGSAGATSGIVPFQFAFTWAVGTALPSNYAISLNGSTLSMSGNVGNLSVSGGNGSNLYLLQISDTSTTPATLLAQAGMVVEISVASGSEPGSFSLSSPPLIYGAMNGNLNPAPLQPSGGYPITWNSGTASTPLVIAIDFNPTPGKEFANVG